MTIYLAENIRKFRKEKGLTQEQLAEVLGVSVAAVSKWEIGASVPELTTLIELGRYFDVSIDALLDYDLSNGRICKLQILPSLCHMCGVEYQIIPRYRDFPDRPVLRIL